MVPSELIRTVTEVLNDLEIPYFITGSVASSVYGEVRDTADVDIVAEIELRHIELLRAAFPEDGFYLSEDAMRDAIDHCGQFNIIDSSTGYKADIVIPHKSPLNTSRFRRARRLQPGGENRTFWFASPEDVIIKKLEAYHDGASDKHLRDVAGIVKTMGERLDRDYINQWCIQLDLKDEWQSILDQSSKPS